MVYSSLSCSLTCQARQFPRLWSWSNQETLFFLYILPARWFDLAEDRVQLPPTRSPPPFLFSIHPAPPVCASFACIVFEQCAVWTVRSWGNRRASSPPLLLSPASPSDAIKAYVSLKKGGRGQQETDERDFKHGAITCRQHLNREDRQSRAESVSDCIHVPERC